MNEEIGRIVAMCADETVLGKLLMELRRAYPIELPLILGLLGFKAEPTASRSRPHRGKPISESRERVEKIILISWFHHEKHGGSKRSFYQSWEFDKNVLNRALRKYRTSRRFREATDMLAQQGSEIDLEKLSASMRTYVSSLKDVQKLASP